LDGIGHRAEHLRLERQGTAIPKLGQAVGSIEYRGRVASTLVSFDPDRNSRSIRECQVWFVAASAGDSTVRREPGVEIKQSPQIRFLRGVRVVRRPDDGHQAKRLFLIIEPL